MVADDKDISVFFNYDLQAILQDHKHHFLIVCDISMFITKDNITARFKNFRIIEYVKMHVPHNAIFQIAEILIGLLTFQIQTLRIHSKLCFPISLFYALFTFVNVGNVN